MRPVIKGLPKDALAILGQLDSIPVTTPSAIGDGFCRYARASAPRWRGEAQSEPKNLSSTVEITTDGQATRGTLVPSVLQCLTDGCATSATPLRRSAWVNLHEHATSFFRFVREFQEEGTPPYVMNGLCEPTGREPFDVKVFDSNEAVPVYDATAQFVVEVGPLVCCPRRYISQQHYGFSTSAAASFSSSRSTLRSPQLCLGISIETRIRYDFPVRENSKAFQAYVYTYNGIAGREHMRFGYGAKAHVPSTTLSLEASSLDYAFYRAMHFDSDVTGPLNPQLFRWHYFAAITVCRERDAVIASMRSESWESWFVSTLDASEECGKGFIKPTQYVLTAAIISNVNQAGSTNLLELTILAVIIDTLFCNSVRPYAFCEGGVVKITGRTELPRQEDRLRFRWVEAVLKRLSHLTGEGYATSRRSSSMSAMGEPGMSFDEAWKLARRLKNG